MTALAKRGFTATVFAALCMVLADVTAVPATASNVCASGDLRVSSLTPSVTRAECDLAGRRVSFHGVSVVGAVGYTVEALALTLDGSISLSVTILDDGTQVIDYEHGVAQPDPTSRGPAAKVITGDECNDSYFALSDNGGEHDDHQWWFNRDTVPSYLKAAKAEQRIRQGARHLVKGRTDCSTSMTASLRATFKGLTTKRANMTGAPNTCTSRDGQNTVDFGDLSTSLVALACIWHTTFPVHEVQESDVRFNNDPSEIAFHVKKKRPKVCNGRYDLEGTMTHERGHTFGLRDVSASSHPNLTMRSSGLTDCSNEQRSLGLGDIRGLNAMY